MPVKKGSKIRQRPAVLKARDGTLHTERENKAAPKFNAGVPDMPPYLSASEQECWEKFAKVLHGSYKILMKEHFAAFESLVVTYDHMRRLDQLLRETDDLVVETVRLNKQGMAVGTQLAAHPLLTSRRQLVSELRQTLAIFGLTPADMNRVSKVDGGDAKEENPDDEFAERGVA